MTQRTQYRATCAVCFREQAVDGIFVAPHGYTLPHGWHMRNAQCHGSNQPHFGTPLGRKVTEGEMGRIHEYTRVKFNEASVVRSGRGEVWGSGRHAQIVKHPTTFERNQYALNCEAQAEAALRAITALQNRVNGWRETVARAVQLDVKSAEERTMHFYGPVYGRNGKYCASSVMGARRFSERSVTTDRSAVTCPNCLKRLAKQTQKGVSA